VYVDGYDISVHECRDFFNPLKHSGNWLYHLVYHSEALHFATQCSYVFTEGEVMALNHKMFWCLHVRFLAVNGWLFSLLLFSEIVWCGFFRI